MSENKNILGEEELDVVTGGNNSSTPEVDTTCWFTPNGNTRADGRKECAAHCKGNFNKAGEPVNELRELDCVWKQCKCHGSNACVNRWHLDPCGHPKRF